MKAQIAFAAALFAMLPLWSTGANGAPISYTIEATETLGPGTFAGRGSITFDADVDLNAVAITDFDFRLSTQGSLDSKNVTHRFDYALADIISSAQLVLTESFFFGILTLADKTSVVPAVSMQSLVLNFSTGMASGFCFDSVGSAECIKGGGTSTSLESTLMSASVVSEPPALPVLAVAGLVLLGIFRLRRSRTH